MDQLHKQFGFPFFLTWWQKWNLILKCKMLSQKLFGHTIQLHLIYAILYERKYMPEFSWIEGNLGFFYFCMIFFNYCKTEFWQKWYFVTKIVLLWEKNVLAIEKNFWNLRLKAKFLRPLEQFIQTVKRQNNFW